MGNATAYINSFSVTLGPTPFTWTIYCIYTGNFSIRLTSRFFFLSSRFTQSLGATNILKWGMFPFRYVFGKSVYNGAPLKSPDPLPGVRASWHLCHLWIFILLILFFFFPLQNMTQNFFASQSLCKSRFEIMKKLRIWLYENIRRVAWLGIITLQDDTGSL